MGKRMLYSNLCLIRGGGYICLWYMHILLYVKLIQCSGFPEIYAQLGVCLPSVYVELIQCSGFPDVYAQLEEGPGVSLPWVYAHSAICETDSV